MRSNGNAIFGVDQALGISTGRLEWEWGAGTFDPVISDGENIYLTGHSGVYALTPH